MTSVADVWPENSERFLDFARNDKKPARRDFAFCAAAVIGAEVISAWEGRALSRPTNLWDDTEVVPPHRQFRWLAQPRLQLRLRRDGVHQDWVVDFSPDLNV
jgi:hypothetical protein